MILHKIEELVMINLSPLCIEGQAPQRNAFSLKRSKAELSLDLPLAQVQGWEEGVTLSSSSYTSSDSSNCEEEEGEEAVIQLVLNIR